MKNGWAVGIPRDSAGAIASLWAFAEIEVCEVERQLWLRGNRADDKLDHRLRLLPGAERFRVGDGGQLVPADCIVPYGSLPSGPWTPLGQWLDVQLPATRWPGQPVGATMLRLIRSTAGERPVGALLVSLADFSAYVETASEIRLRRWMFAASADRQVIVRGGPLPSLAGTRLVDEEGILIPAGWRWTPEVDARTLRKALGLESGEVAIFSIDGSWQRIAATSFVAATRTAVRLTVAHSTKSEGVENG